jgi:glutathione S-transferase
LTAAADSFKYATIMKIYDFTGAPNPRRVRVFLAEKGINNVPFEQINIATADNRKPEFLTSRTSSRSRP